MKTWKPYAQENPVSSLGEPDYSLSRIAENIPDMIFEFQEEKNGIGKFTYVSKASEEIFELSPSNLLHSPLKLWETIHPEDLAGLAERLRKCSETSSLLHWHGRLISSVTYRLKWIKVSARPEQLPEGKLKWHGVVNDITKLKTIELELEYARGKAQQEAKAKENFLATMSHEIRTPLNGIVGLTELLSLSARPDQEEQLELLQFSANNLMSLINNILDFSKLNSGKMKVSERAMRFRAMLENLRKIHKYRAESNHTELKFDIDPSLPQEISADEMILMQVLNNLLGNAIKFTKRGTVTLGVKLQSISKERISILVEIEDTGIGISEENLERIFYEFEQAGGNQSGSSGLGLPICKKLLALMNSDLKVVSEVGKGSRFYFELQVGVIL